MVDGLTLEGISAKYEVQGGTGDKCTWPDTRATSRQVIPSNVGWIQSNLDLFVVSSIYP